MKIIKGYENYKNIRLLQLVILRENPIQRGKTTNGKIGPVADQTYAIWNPTIFVI